LVLSFQRKIISMLNWSTSVKLRYLRREFDCALYYRLILYYINLTHLLSLVLLNSLTPVHATWESEEGESGKEEKDERPVLIDLGDKFKGSWITRKVNIDNDYLYYFWIDPLCYV
jgi:hypothetical protein